MRVATAAVLAAAFAVSGAAQDTTAQPGPPARAFPKPDRPVADIVSPIWHDEKERDAAGEPEQLVRLLGIGPGMTVADVGAGSGYYVARLSPIVGPHGRIFAEDVMPEYLRSLRKRVGDLGLHNVTISRGEPHDPRLPPASVDIAILVHMYHEIAQPLRPALQPRPRAQAGRARRHCRRVRPHIQAWHPAGPSRMRARRRRLSRDQARSSGRQRCLSRDVCAAVGSKPHAPGSDGRVQGALTRLRPARNRMTGNG